MHKGLCSDRAGLLYLETGQCERAASHYITWLTRVSTDPTSPFFEAFTSGRRTVSAALTDRPSDWDQSSNSSVAGASTWSVIFTSNATADIITYIPMAVNRTVGTVTNVPMAFGYNYYATDSEARQNGLYVDEVQIEPSDSYLTLSDSTDYYYYPIVSGLPRSQVSIAKLGDQRAANTLLMDNDDELSTKIWVRKYENANIVLYRTSTVLLHLAEAFNRLDMPDAAFAILKDGIGAHLLSDDAAYYMTDATKQALRTTYPLLSSANISKFENAGSRIGIHMHGAGMCRDYNGQDYVESPYRFDTIVGQKLGELAAAGYPVGTTRADTINAVEDILCDEYALELAFEGTRWYDLMRLARHKNAAALYDANFGSRWLARKLAYKQPVVNLEDKNNWYLPFK